MDEGIVFMTKADASEFEEVKAALRARAPDVGVVVCDVERSHAGVTGNYLDTGLRLSYQDSAYDIFYDFVRAQTDMFQRGKCLLTFSSNPNWGAGLILQEVKERTVTRFSSWR